MIQNCFLEKHTSKLDFCEKIYNSFFFEGWCSEIELEGCLIPKYDMFPFARLSCLLHLVFTNLIFIISAS